MVAFDNLIVVLARLVGCRIEVENINLTDPICYSAPVTSFPANLLV